MADGLDFGFPTDVTSGVAAPPLDVPSFNFQPPNLSADLNIGNLAGATGVPGVAGGVPNVNLASTDTYTPGADAFTGTGPTPDKSTFDTISDYAKKAAPILGLGTTAAQVPLQLARLSQTGRAEKAMESAVATEREAAAPGIAAEQKILPAGTEALLTGNLPPELQAAVDDQVNQTKQALLQQLTKQGIDPAQANAMIEGQLQELRTRLTLQYAEGLMAGGEGAGGLATKAAGSGGTLAAGEASADPLTAANQALARLTASA